MQTRDYRDNHLGAEKAKEYAPGFEAFGTSKHLLWQVEQRLLRSILAGRDTRRESLLDFACGTGRILGFLEPRFRRSVGVDVSPVMTAWARERCARAEIIVSDITKDSAPLRNEQFHVITAFRFFLNAQPELRLAALAELRSRLRDDGILVVNFHLNPRSLSGMRVRLGAAVRGRPCPPMLSRSETEALLTKAGFQIRRVFGYGYLTYHRDRVSFPRARLVTELGLAGRLHAGLAQNLLIVARKA